MWKAREWALQDDQPLANLGPVQMLAGNKKHALIGQIWSDRQKEQPVASQSGPAGSGSTSEKECGHCDC